ncbi:hypothetical protein [Luteolibacter sp. LG18]|uniref:hypothetical protein n=1 Tax=Luteolibacter sp. LG18 TaxID=2819286 RepID=UPI002B2D96BE|nr:hypothetical protein llg_00910 [Luteolibacter sp. LG18]
MSEYQYYEFLAIDTLLDKDQQAALRAVSTRAKITSRSFINTYEWGDLKADPMQWMEDYFDAHIYLSNFGTPSFHVRLPLSLVDLSTTQAYETDSTLRVDTTQTHVIFSFMSDREPEDRDEYDYAGNSALASLLPIREQLARGDLRPLYVAWLSAADYHDLEESTQEPPVPPGLDEADGVHHRLASFLHLDSDLLTIAAANSLPAESDRATGHEAAKWLPNLSPAQKDAWLQRLLVDHNSSALFALQREFHSAHHPTANPPALRKVGQLIEDARKLTRVRRAEEARQLAAAKLAEEQRKAELRTQYLHSLKGREDSVWETIVHLTESSTASKYQTAVEKIVDLRELSHLTHSSDHFEQKLAEFRDLRSRKAALIARLNAAGLV